MINYSIAMRGVNSNLFEINQAKKRINEAKAKGEVPKQTDLDLVATEVQKAFAVAQYAEVMDIEKFAKHISTHGCVYSRADIGAILYMAVDCMREQLLEGRKIRLGDLGDFSVTINSIGAASADKFTAQNIIGVNVVWDPGKDFKTLFNDAEFNLVASRSVQAAVLKALKANQGVVDITSPDNTPDGGGDSTGETPDDTGTDSGSGSDSGGGSGTDSGGGSGSESGGSSSGGSSGEDSGVGGGIYE